MITYQELLDGAIRRLPTEMDDKKEAWRKHVELALELKENLKANRMIIAEIAERSCIIRLGGDKRSEEFSETAQRLTLKHFCKETGLQYTTVNTWILVKNRIFQKLPKAHQGSGFNLTVAIETGQFFKARGYFGREGKEPTSAEIKEIYEQRIKPSERKLRQIRVFKYLRAAAYYLAVKKNWPLYDEDGRQELRQFCLDILSSLNDYEHLLKKRKK